MPRIAKYTRVMVSLGHPQQQLRPVMTFQVDDLWIGVRVEQMESVCLAERLWKVPESYSYHLGLHDTGERLVPVLALRGNESSTTKVHEQLIAILHVRGESIGMAIERAGRVHDHYWIEEKQITAPPGIEEIGGQRARSVDDYFWLIDTDSLWPPN